MGFFVILGIIFVLLFAYFAAPIIEKQSFNYVKGLLHKKKKN